MILGIGVDVVYVSRILNLINKYKERFINRVYSHKEIEASDKIKDCKIKSLYFAKRFAAKEAFVKALGTGFSSNARMQEISIINDNLGKPMIHLLGNTKQYFDANPLTKNAILHLSLSDEKDIAIALVIIEQS